MIRLRKLFAVLVLFAMICCSMTAIVDAVEERYVPDDVIVFLKDVVNLDLTKYSVAPFKPGFSYREDLANLTELFGKVSLHSLGELSEIDVTYLIINNTLVDLGMKLRAGLPIYNQKTPAYIGQKAKDFLSDYQIFLGDAELATMRSMVDKVDATKNSSITSANIMLEVEARSWYTSFNWHYTFNGAKYDGMNLSFDENGTFTSFGDSRGYLEIGGTDVNITAEEAINIALEHVANYSYVIRGKVVEDFKVVKEAIKVELFTMSKDNPLVKYPHWWVVLPLDKEYPGLVWWIEVSLWADTGEIIDCVPLGGGGSLPTVNTPTPPANSFVSLSGDALVYVGVGAIVTIAVLAGITVVLKIRKSKTLTS